MNHETEMTVTRYIPNKNRGDMEVKIPDSPKRSCVNAIPKMINAQSTGNAFQSIFQNIAGSYGERRKGRLVGSGVLWGIGNVEERKMENRKVEIRENKVIEKNCFTAHVSF
jgi:hypothetical protein